MTLFPTLDDKFRRSEVHNEDPRRIFEDKHRYEPTHHISWPPSNPLIMDAQGRRASFSGLGSAEGLRVPAFSSLSFLCHSSPPEFTFGA